MIDIIKRAVDIDIKYSKISMILVVIFGNKIKFRL
jgi:hypothetical protein